MRFLFPLISTLLIFTPVINAQPPATTSCPQIEFGSSFKLVEGLKNDASQNSYILYYENPDFSIFLKPGCVDETSKYIDLYKGTYIAAFSNRIAEPGFAHVRITSSCHAKPLFVITQQDFAYKVTDAAGRCLAVVASQDNLSNELTLKDCNLNPIAHATKTLASQALQTPEGNFPSQATWQVNQTATDLTAQVMPFILAMKDNAGFSCSASTEPAAQPKSFSTAASIFLYGGIAAIVGTTFAAITWVYCKRQQPTNQYQQVTGTDLNEIHVN